MEISEINEFNIDNTATLSLNVNNTFTSDELVTNEGNSYISTFALNKRIENASKKVGLILTLSISVFTGATSISNVLLGADPIIKNFNNCYATYSQRFTYNFDIEIENSILKMNIFYAESIVYSYTFKESGVYKNSLQLLDLGDYNVKFYSTNLFDYEKELTDYSFTFTIFIDEVSSNE